MSHWLSEIFYKQFSKQYDIDKVQSSSKVVIKKNQQLT